jgi:DNA-binding transcriptional LysR family regulator
MKDLSLSSPVPPPPKTNANPLSTGDLAAFVAVVETASLHGAADALDMTQSAVTKRIQALERRLGVALLERGRFGARPTIAGRLLYPEAKQALAAVQRAQDLVGEHLSTGRRALALAASHTIGGFLLPGWLASFRQDHPDLRAQVEIVNSRLVLLALRERRAEVGFVEGTESLTDYERLLVQRDSIVVAVGAGHRWARRRSLEPQELLQEPYLTREEGSGTRETARAALERAGVVLEPMLETASLQSVKRALLAGGFSLLSTLAVEAECRQGVLRAIPLRGLGMTRELQAVRDPRARASALAQRFWAWLAQRAPAAARQLAQAAPR